jgi:hypothetical protein
VEDSKEQLKQMVARQLKDITRQLSYDNLTNRVSYERSPGRTGYGDTVDEALKNAFLGSEEDF